MKLTPEWWSDKKAVLPEKKEEFRVEDTIDALLGTAPPELKSAFERILDRSIADEGVRDKVLKQRALFGLCMASDDVREAVAAVFHFMKNPDLIVSSSSSSSRLPKFQTPSSTSPADGPSKPPSDLTQRALEWEERIKGTTGGAKPMTAKDLGLGNVDVDGIVNG